MTKRKGILLAGGEGNRLKPLTSVTCKQLLPVYDKPMIYYSLSTLMLSGVQEILIISTPEATPLLEAFLGDGSHLGLQLSYAVQEEPKGIAEAFLIGEDFLQGAPCVLALGDNIFYGAGLYHLLQEAGKSTSGAVVFGVHVRDPERFGVLALDASGNVTDIIEKPQNPPSPYAVVGLYFYDEHVVEHAKRLTPSKRGELEITDLNRLYLQEGALTASILGRGNMWMDVGTHTALLEAGHFIAQIDERQGLKIGCPEEIARRMHYIDNAQLKELAAYYTNSGSGYGRYLSALAEEMHEAG